MNENPIQLLREALSVIGKGQRKVDIHVADKIRKYLKVPVCTWKQDGEDSDIWLTSCGNAFCIDTRPEETMNYCCYCGRELLDAPHKDSTI